MTAGRSRDIGSLLDRGKKQLKKSGIEDFDISAEALLRHVLNLKRTELLLSPGKSVDRNKIDEYKNLISERAKHVPLQYLVGFVEFYNVKIKCDRRALIPRPETEILVDIVIEALREFKSPKILDIGTGSGNIAVALAKNIFGSLVIGIDIDRGALDLAKENSIENSVQNHVKFISGDILNAESIGNLGVFDCIVSNPPYVAESERDRLQPEVIEYEPLTALFSPGDPLRFFKVIIERTAELLSSHGLVAFEVGMGQAAAVKDMMSPKFTALSSFKDLNGIERVVAGFSKE